MRKKLKMENDNSKSINTKQKSSKKESIENMQNNIQNGDDEQGLPPKVEEAIEVLEGLDEPQKRMVATRTMFQGPIPPPSMLAEYEKIESGLASRIVAMAEKEQNAAISDRREMLTLVSKDTKRGAYLSFLTIVLLFSLGLLALYLNRDLAGYGLLISGIVSIAMINKKDPKDNDE